MGLPHRPSVSAQRSPSPSALGQQLLSLSNSRDPDPSALPWEEWLLLWPLPTGLVPSLSYAGELTPAQKTEGAEWGGEQAVSRTVVAPCSGEAVGQGLTTRAFLAWNPKGPWLGVPGEMGLSTPSSVCSEP